MSTPPRALLSVSDKTGLAAFAEGLAALGFELVSTGGTAAMLRGAGLTVTEVSELTGFPEMMDGRVKTLHPAVHAGLLARRTVDDAALAAHGIRPFDVLAVNLYPFEATIAAPDCRVPDAIENIDVGGPAMLRAAAKNHDRLTVVVDSADYPGVLRALRAGGTPEQMRRQLAVKAFSHTAAYDAAIARYLRVHAGQPEEIFPDALVLAFRRVQELRYGENPHQRGAVYTDALARGASIARARQHQGKPLSFNNFADADAGLRCALAFADTACVIVKHANPCGAAIGDSPRAAYQAAFRTDPTSAFGGVIAFNRPLDVAAADAIVAQQLVDVIVAPGFEPAALQALGNKPNTRVLEVADPDEPDDVLEVKNIAGGLLVQQRDTGTLASAGLRTVTKRSPTEDELRDLEFAWIVVKFVKSNAIVYAAGGRTVGIGAGQMSRVMSARIAAIKAASEGLALAGSVMASDAFFPFRDGIDTAADNGVRAVIQPGGSMRDDEVIRAADEHGMAMVFTSMRHFRH